MLTSFKGFLRKSKDAELSSRSSEKPLQIVSSTSKPPTGTDSGKEFKTMPTGSFPSDPAKRRAILILQKHDVEKCFYEQGAAKALLDDEVHILQLPARPESEISTALQNILDAGLARPRSMLVQSPYDSDTYEEASLAPQRYALAKHMLFSTFCMRLGAKEVSVDQIENQTRTGKVTLEVKGKRLGSSAELTVEQKEIAKIAVQMNLRYEFTGGPPDLGGAEQLLRRTGLWADSGMRSLLEMRSDGSNQLLTRKLVLSLSNDAKSNLKVVGRLKLPAFIKLSAELDRVVHEQYDFTVTEIVRF